jgi:hypothetical protein
LVYKQKRNCSGRPHWALKIGHWRIDKTEKKAFPCLTVVNFQYPMPNLLPDETGLSIYTKAFSNCAASRIFLIFSLCERNAQAMVFSEIA